MDTWSRGSTFITTSKITIWRNDGIVKNIEADQGHYMAEVNHVDKRNFNKNLANIIPCTPTWFV